MAKEVNLQSNNGFVVLEALIYLGYHANKDIVNKICQIYGFPNGFQTDLDLLKEGELYYYDEVFAAIPLSCKAVQFMIDDDLKINLVRSDGWFSTSQLDFFLIKVKEISEELLKHMNIIIGLTEEEYKSVMEK